MTRAMKTLVTAVAIVLAFILLWLVLLTPNQAGAATSQKQLQIASYSSSTTTTTPRVVGTTSCRSTSRTIVTRNYLGYVLFRFTGYGYWCWSGGKVRSVQWSQSGTVGGQIWNTYEYLGLSSDVRGGSVGGNYVYRRAYGNFRACIPALHWCQSQYPFVTLTLRGDGTSSAGSGF